MRFVGIAARDQRTREGVERHWTEEDLGVEGEKLSLICGRDGVVEIVGNRVK